jgi:hypothetical protein
VQIISAFVAPALQRLDFFRRSKNQEKIVMAGHYGSVSVPPERTNVRGVHHAN